MHGRYSPRDAKRPGENAQPEIARPGASHMVKALKIFNPPAEIGTRLAMRVGTVMAEKLTSKNARGENMRLGTRDKAAHREFFISAVNAGLGHEGWEVAREADGAVSRRDAGISSIRRRCISDFGDRQGPKLANDAHAIIQLVRAYSITERDGLEGIIQDLTHSRKYDELQREYITDLVGGYLHARSRESAVKKRLSPKENRMPAEKVHDAPVSLQKPRRGGIGLAKGRAAGKTSVARAKRR